MSSVKNNKFGVITAWNNQGIQFPYSIYAKWCTKLCKYLRVTANDKAH